MILLRKATDADLPLIMAWRSNPLNYQGYYSQTQPLFWGEHLNWWKSRPSSWKEFIVVLSEGTTMRDIGIVQIGQLEHWSPEIGYTIGNPTDQGKGYGTEAVRQVIDWLKEQGYQYCHTTIKDDNKASIKLIRNLGFKRGDIAREGEHWYHRRII